MTGETLTELLLCAIHGPKVILRMQIQSEDRETENGECTPHASPGEVRDSPVISSQTQSRLKGPVPGQAATSQQETQMQTGPTLRSRNVLFLKNLFLHSTHPKSYLFESVSSVAWPTFSVFEAPNICTFPDPLGYHLQTSKSLLISF